ncbi:hypothetical protein Leryth_020034 [Lithospermum erythrorhizon]|nr:hypothetical protein Leryth_020034 [Lithospermum erythrorhizon]
MLAYVKILEECPNTGMMIMHWIKKFPFIWKDREYIIGRRIWEAGRTYHCVTKGVPYPSVPRSENLFRVVRYFSSWVIRAVQCRKGDGELSACEVTLIHYEDMGLPKDVTKFGVRHGMWGAVQKTHAGFRDYQSLRESGVLHSKYALMSSIMTSISEDEGTHSVEQVASQEDRGEQASLNAQAHQGKRGLNWKWIVIGGTVAVMCGLHAGFIGKIFVGRSKTKSC